MHLVRGIPTSDVPIPAEKGKQGPGGAGEGESGVRLETGGLFFLTITNNNPKLTG